MTARPAGHLRMVALGGGHGLFASLSALRRPTTDALGHAPRGHVRLGDPRDERHARVDGGRRGPGGAGQLRGEALPLL